MVKIKKYDFPFPLYFHSTYKYQGLHAYEINQIKYCDKLFSKSRSIFKVISLMLCIKQIHTTKRTTQSVTLSPQDPPPSED